MDPTLIRGAAIAVNTIRMANTIIVEINGKVFKSNKLRSYSSRLSPETSLQRLILCITLLNKLGGLADPLKNDVLPITLPDIGGAQTLSIREGNSGSISDPPLNNFATL